jgi:hypothetical protein
MPVAGAATSLDITSLDIKATAQATIPICLEGQGRLGSLGKKMILFHKFQMAAGGSGNGLIGTVL